MGDFFASPLAEGATRTLTLSRPEAGAAGVISLSFIGSGASADAASKAIAAHETAVTFVITAESDGIVNSAIRTVAAIVQSSNANFRFGHVGAPGVNVAAFTLEISNTDAPSNFTPSFSPSEIDEGGAATLTVARGALETGTTGTITIAPEAGLTADALSKSIGGSETAVTFTITAGYAPGLDDVVRSIVLSSNRNFFSFNPETATLTVKHADAPLTATLSPASIGEGAATTLTVNRPAPVSAEDAEVAITFSSAANLRDADTGAAVNETTTLTLTGTATSATLRLRSLNDDEFGVAEQVQIGLSSNTAGYAVESRAGRADKSDAFTLTLTDDDLALIQPVLSAASIGEGEAATLRFERVGGADALAASRNTEVKIQVALSGDADELSAASRFATRLFTIPVGVDVSETHTFAALNDFVVDDNAPDSVRLTFSEAPELASFALTDASLSLALTDDDARVTLTAALSSSSIDEGEQTQLTLTAAAPAPETVAITVSISESPASPAGLVDIGSPRVIVIPRGGVSAPAVTLTATDDDESDPASVATLAFALDSASGADGVFNPIPNLTLTLTDSDAPPVAIPGAVGLARLTRVSLPPTLAAIGGTSQRVALEYAQGSGAELQTTVSWRVTGAGGSVVIADQIVGRDAARNQPEFAALLRFGGVGSATLRAEVTQRDASGAVVATLLSNPLRVTVSPPARPPIVSTPRPAPVNPPGPVPETIFGAPVATPELGGAFDGPSNSGVTVPAGAATDHLGVRLIALAAPPAAGDLPPSLGAFIPGALILDVTFQAPDGAEVGLLDRAATVCLPFDDAILTAVDGDISRLQIARYHNGAWQGLVSAPRFDAGVICALSQAFSAFALTARTAALTDAGAFNGLDEISGALPQTGGGFALPLWTALTLAWVSAALLIGAMLFVRVAARRRANAAPRRD